MLQLLAIVVLIATTSITGAYAQDVNETQEQKPTEEKQGGEYSGFEEAEADRGNTKPRCQPYTSGTYK
jgi:hypothetical protein